MKIDLTERDKKLLKVLAVLCAFAIPYFLLIKPLNEKIEEQQQLNIEAQAQVDAYNNAQVTLETKNEELIQSSEALLKATPNTNEMINNFETHYVFMDLMNRNNLQSTSLTISDPVVDEAVIEPVTPESFSTYEYLPVPINKINLGNLATYNLQTPYSVDVSLTVEGNIEDINRLIDSINYYSDYFLVNSVNVSTPSEGGVTQAQIGVKVYFTGAKPVATESEATE